MPPALKRSAFGIPFSEGFTEAQGAQRHGPQKQGSGGRSCVKHGAFSPAGDAASDAP